MDLPKSGLCFLYSVRLCTPPTQVRLKEELFHLLIVSGGLACGNIFISLKALESKSTDFPTPDLGPADMLALGTSQVFNYPTKNIPALLIRRTNGEYIAFQQKSPHLACPVTYHAQNGESLRCYCHNGAFDLRTGQGIQGPPRELRPLKEVLLKNDGTRLWAIGLS